MNKKTITSLFRAIEVDDRDVIDEVLDSNSDGLDSVGFHNRNVRDKSPLMYAMQSRRLTLVNYFLDKGADAAATMAGGPKLSALALCAKFAYADAANHDQWIAIAIRLLDQGADPTSALWPALHGYGGIVERTDLIRLFLERGADADHELADSGNTIRELVAVNRRLYSGEVLGLFGISNPPE